MISSDSLNSSNYLGQPFAVSFDTVSVFITTPNRITTLCTERGSFAVMLKASNHPAGLDSAHSSSLMPLWNGINFFILRLNAAETFNNLKPPVSNHTHQHGQKFDDDDSKNSLVLTYRVLGSFNKEAGAAHTFYFSGDIGHVLPAQNYGVFSPSPDLLRLIVNGTNPSPHHIQLGLFRVSESTRYLVEEQPVYLSMLDIRGKRSAMFGKTRLGKSNVVKLLVQGMLDATAKDASVGQLIFDVNGEYANDNPQDGVSIASAHPERCLVYYLSRRNASGAGKLLRFNLYERTEHALEILRELLPTYIAESSYVRNLLNCRLPPLAREAKASDEHAVRELRKLMLFWTILNEAGFDHHENRLGQRLQTLGFKTLFNPCFSQALRLAAYQAIRGASAPASPQTFEEMAREMMVIAKFSLTFPNDPNLVRNGSFVFDHDELIMARFLVPQSSEGPFVLRPCVPFHSPSADNFSQEILQALNTGKTVVVDLGSANEQIIRYFAKTLSIAIFQAQEEKFVNNQLNNQFVQIYFEEAHMIFPPNSGHVIDVYSRFAKEGAKFNIGIVYSTQSPSTINQDLLAQTENFFIGHLSSEREVQTLACVQYAFRGSEEDIMRSRSPGFIRMLSYSNRYLIPLQANRYTGESLLAL